jgi:hypothetical protein
MIRIILCITFSIFLSKISLAASANGVAEKFEITMTKVELCTGAPLTNEHDVTCTGATLVGEGSMTFDIASVSAGSAVGTFVATTGLPIGTTFTHVKPTMTRTFTLKGSVEIDGNCTCRTESSSTFNTGASYGKYKSLQAGSCTGSAEDQTLYLPTDGTVFLCQEAACTTTGITNTVVKDPTGLDSSYGLAMEDPAVSQDTFSMIYQLASPYTVSAVAPKINISFATLTALGTNEYTDGKCFVEVYYPRAIISVTD